MNNISTPICVHFAACSGCEILLDETPPVWNSILSFFQTFSIKPELHTSKRQGWRLKAKLAVRGTSHNPIIGLFKKGTHETLPIPHCLVHHPSINTAVSIIRSAMIEQALSPYDELTQTGLLRYLQFFVNRATGQIQLALILNASTLDPIVEKFCSKLFKNPLFHSIWVNFHPDHTNRILGSIWQKVCGEEWFYQPICNREIAFHPGAFSQAHLDLFEILLDTIRLWVPPHSHIVELFAGVGAIGLSFEPSCQKLLLVESNPFAKISYDASPQSPKCTYLLQDASEFDDFNSYDTIIVDPPRKGLGQPLLKKLSDLNNHRLIYISCGWESFQKDASSLISSGWTLKKAEGFLLFPGTNHIETAALFEKA